MNTIVIEYERIDEWSFYYYYIYVFVSPSSCLSVTEVCMRKSYIKKRISWKLCMLDCYHMELRISLQQQHLHIKYISQLIRNSYHDFLDRGLLLARKLLNQRFLVVIWWRHWYIQTFLTATWSYHFWRSYFYIGFGILHEEIVMAFPPSLSMGIPQNYAWSLITIMNYTYCFDRSIEPILKELLASFSKS
jgi:hypothetical protein